jgi:hypothetical protein
MHTEIANLALSVVHSIMDKSMSDSEKFDRIAYAMLQATTAKRAISRISAAPYIAMRGAK